MIVTGRTKHTGDDRPVSPTVVAVQEVKRLRMIIALMRLMIICSVAGLVAWAAYGAIVSHMEAPEKERRIRACAVAMEHEEHLRGPVAQCESLSPAERRSAAYEYGRMRDLW